MENSFMSESMQNGQEMQMEDAQVRQEERNMDPAGAEQQAEEAAGTEQQAEEAAEAEQQAEDLAEKKKKKKDILSIKAAVEAVLFAMGDSLDLETISEAVGMPAPELEKVLKEMTEDYDAANAPYGRMKVLKELLSQVPGLGCAFDTGNFVCHGSCPGDQCGYEGSQTVCKHHRGQY